MSNDEVVILLEYHFSTREAMQESIKRGEFIESAEYSGNLYGTRYSTEFVYCFS